MHPVRDHVCEWEEGSAHGQEPLLWWRELLHHPSGGGKVLLGSIKPINTFYTPQYISFYFQCHRASAAAFTASSSVMLWPLSASCISSSQDVAHVSLLLHSCTSASVFQTARPSPWAEDGTGTLISSPNSSWPTVSHSSLTL